MNRTFLYFLLLISAYTVEAKTIKYPNGDVYKGNVENNQPHGEGVMTYANGNTYTGNWDNGKRSGKGVYVFVGQSNVKIDGTWAVDTVSSAHISLSSPTNRTSDALFQGVVTSNGIIGKTTSKEIAMSENRNVVGEINYCFTGEARNSSVWSGLEVIHYTRYNTKLHTHYENGSIVKQFYKEDDFSYSGELDRKNEIIFNKPLTLNTQYFEVTGTVLDNHGIYELQEPIVKCDLLDKNQIRYRCLEAKLSPYGKEYSVLVQVLFAEDQRTPIVLFMTNQDIDLNKVTSPDPSVKLLAVNDKNIESVVAKEKADVTGKLEQQSSKSRHVKVEIAKPGTILSYMDPSELDYIDSLTVQGFLYTTDIEVINKCNYLKYIDLSRTIITKTPQDQADEKAELETLISMFKGLGKYADAQYEDMNMTTADYYTVKSFSNIFKNAEVNEIAIAQCFIPKKAFEGLENLETIKFPKLAKSIELGVCNNCKNLKNVVLPEYLDEIAKAFVDCTSLSSIKFPKTLTSISEFAFQGCVLDDLDLSLCKFGKFNRSKLPCDIRNTIKLPLVSTGARYANGYNPTPTASIKKSSEKVVYLTNNIDWVNADNQELHFSNPVPPQNGTIKNCTIYCPKDSKTAYFAKFGESNRYIEE